MPEQYTYQVGKINFIVTPVYKDKRSGETMKDILLKLVLADLESGDILNIGGSCILFTVINTNCKQDDQIDYKCNINRSHKYIPPQRFCQMEATALPL